MEEGARMNMAVSNDFQVTEADTDPDLRLLETVSLRVEPSKSVSRSMVSLESVPSSLVDWPASRLRLYSFPWRRRSTASHILTHQVLRIRRRFRWALRIWLQLERYICLMFEALELFLVLCKCFLENCIRNVATIGWKSIKLKRAPVPPTNVPMTCTPCRKRSPYLNPPTSHKKRSDWFRKAGTKSDYSRQGRWGGDHLSKF